MIYLYKSTILSNLNYFNKYFNGVHLQQKSVRMNSIWARAWVRSTSDLNDKCVQNLGGSRKETLIKKVHFVIFKVIDDTRHHASIWTSKWTFRATATRTIRHCRWMKRQFYHQKYCTAKNRQKRMSGQSTGDNRIVA